MITTPESSTEGLSYVHASHENIMCAVYGLLAIRQLCATEDNAINRAALFGLIGPIVMQVEYAANLLEAHIDAANGGDGGDDIIDNRKVEKTLQDKHPRNQRKS